MGWISLVESGGLPWLFPNGLNQSHIAKMTPIVKESSCLEWPEDYSPLLLSGMTQPLFIKHRITDSSTLFTQAFRARISVLHELEKVWKESEADYFSRSCAWPRKSSPVTYSLKTYRQSPTEEESKQLKKLPRWGMTVDGVLYPLHQLARRIKEKDGFYWPTPDASSRGARIHQNGHQKTIQDVVGSGKLNPEWITWLMGYPTGWINLEPWAMQWFQLKRKKRLKS